MPDDGEIWSASLWELRGLLGRRVSDRLVLAHHFLLKKDASFEDAAKGLLMADANLNDGHNAAAIRDVFVRRGSCRIQSVGIIAPASGSTAPRAPAAGGRDRGGERDETRARQGASVDGTEASRGNAVNAAPSSRQSTKREHKPMFVVLVRHADPAAGGTDPGLSPAGVHRAGVLAKILADVGITAIFTSDLRRTKRPRNRSRACCRSRRW